MRADAKALATLARPRVLNLLAIALLSRTIVAVLPITLLVTLAQTYGYGIGGAVNGTYTLVLAFLGPLRGRVLDRVGQRRALAAMGAGAMTFMALVAVSVAFRWSWWLSLVLVIAAGLSSPPLNAALRTSWRRVVDDQESLKIVHSADSVLEEVGFVLAPLAAGLALALLQPRHAYEASVGLYILVITAYLLAAKAYGLGQRAGTGTPELATQRTAWQRWLGPLAESQMLLIMVPLLVMGCIFGGIGIFVPAYTQHLHALIWLGPLLAMISIGGVIGGIVYGILPWKIDLWRKYRILMLGFALPCCLLIAARPLWILALLLVLSGLFVTPLFINAFLLVDDAIPEDSRHEANTWIGASADVANGIVAILIGALVAGGHWQSALTVLSGCALVGVVIVLLWRGKAGLDRFRTSAPAADRLDDDRAYT